jgi:hypothetical protein
MLRTSGLALPGRFRHAGNFAFQSKLTEANAAQTEPTNEATRAATSTAAIANLNGEFSPLFTIFHAFLGHTNPS